MAVEIRELVIKCEVRGPAAAKEAPLSGQLLRNLRRELLQACDRRIEEALRRLQER